MKQDSKVLALKYRPQVFEDLIGQDAITKTILNSIKLQKVANAFLFTGIRGVGKTTVARIIAKALNCKNGIDKLCKDNFCENSISIINSNHIDVLEMDAASKTGVDDVRDLIEFSKYGPTVAKYKIFIIDEVHMLSKQAFNALLKTLEEPPQYLKFIFATTEIRKIPVTVVSRCQRFDLSRISSGNLFTYIKKIKDLEKGKVNDEALKLLVKISEGSVRDALSLLDRLLVSQSDDKEINLQIAQEIFGYFDKNSLIDLIKFILEGNEEKTIQIYKTIYQKGVEPKVFLNDFLEILYYIKNIDSLKLEGTNFSLNDQEYKKILDISKSVLVETIILFWQFTIKTIDELDIVSNQNISIEMFLLRLLYLKDIKQKVKSENFEAQIESDQNKQEHKSVNIDQNFDFNNKTVSQIKNISQKENIEPTSEFKEIRDKIIISNFNDLIKVCDEKKELKLKYELETNVNLVRFENQRIEISFNENLDKYFVKDLSTKLFDWTSNRWIIAFSKEEGMPSKKQSVKIMKDNFISNAKKSLSYKKMTELFSDINLTDVQLNNEDD